MAKSFSASTQEYGLDSICERMEEAGALEHMFDDLLCCTLPSVASIINDPREVSVNSTYTASHINIYVPKPEKLEAIVGPPPPSFKSWSDAGNTFKRNFLAVYPNLVFVDDVFLGSLLLGVYAEGMTVQKILQLPWQPTMGKKTTVAWAWNRYHRLALLEMDRDFIAREVQRWDAEGRRQQEAEIQNRLFLPAMLLTFGHEIAHLRTGRAISGSAQVSRRFSDYWLRNECEEEIMADQIVMGKMKAYCDKYIASGREERGSASIVPIIDTFAWSALSNLLRDEVANEMFDGLRGLRAKDLLVTVIQKRDVCNDSEMRRNVWLDMVDFAQDMEIPILNQSEFDNLRDRILEERALDTHAHMFVRTSQFISPLVEYGLPMQGQLELQLLDALKNDTPEIATPSRVHAILSQYPGLGLSRLSIKRALQELAHFQPGVTCPQDTCVIGLFTQSPGYIEMIGPANDIKGLTLVLPTATSEQRNFFYAVIEKIMAAEGTIFTEPQRQGLMEEIEELATCGVYPVLLPGVRVVFFIYRINNSQYSLFGSSNNS